MKNKIKYIIPFIIIFMSFIIPVFAEYIAGKITDVEITRVGDTVYLEGETVGFTSKMRVIIKVLDDKGTLQYFNEVPVDSNGGFYDHFIPMNQEDMYLNFNFSGDLAYSTRFYYSDKYSSSDEAIEAYLLRYLQDYRYYKDDNSKYAMNFIISYEQGKNKANVVLTGTNFEKGDTLFTGKNYSSWTSYLATIRNLSYQITKKEMSILVYDKNNELAFSFPEVIGESGEVETKPPVSTNEIIETIGTKVYYSSNGGTLSFTTSLQNGSSSDYVKIKLKGDFSKADDVWINSSLIDLENFARSLAEKIKVKHVCDIDLDFYDKNGKILNSYSYYYKNDVGGSSGEEAGGNADGSESGSDIVITPVPDMPSVTPPVEDSDETVGTTDEVQAYKPWNPFDDLGIYTLNLMVHSYNSLVIEAPITGEGYEGAIYKYYYTLDDYDMISNAINSMRNDSKKVLIARGNTLGSNINLTVSSDIVELLKANNVTFIFDSSYLKVEADFGTCNYSGDYSIVTNETIAMLTNRTSDAYNIAVTLGGMDAANLFGNKVKVALHYTSESAASASDLRFVTNYYNNSMSLNTTVNQGLRAFISTYNGSGIYCAKENRIIFNDSNFEDNTYRRYAEIVASRGLMDGSGGVFNPKYTMTRGEFVNIVAKKMGVSSYTNYFSDLLGANAYYQSFNGAYEYGLLPTSWRNGAQVDKKITIEEMIYIVVRCYEVNSLNPTSYGSALYYSDADDISAWAKNKIAVAAKLGLIPGDGFLYPTENGTREDAAELLFKLMEVEGLF